MVVMLRRFLSDQSAATAVEYGLICAGIAALILRVISDLGASLIAALTRLLDALA